MFLPAFNVSGQVPAGETRPRFMWKSQSDKRTKKITVLLNIHRRRRHNSFKSDTRGLDYSDFTFSKLNNVIIKKNIICRRGCVYVCKIVCAHVCLGVYACGGSGVVQTGNEPVRTSGSLHSLNRPSDLVVIY